MTRPIKRFWDIFLFLALPTFSLHGQQVNRTMEMLPQTTVAAPQDIFMVTTGMVGTARSTRGINLSNLLNSLSVLPNFPTGGGSGGVAVGSTAQILAVTNGSVVQLFVVGTLTNNISGVASNLSGFSSNMLYSLFLLSTNNGVQLTNVQASALIGTISYGNLPSQPANSFLGNPSNASANTQAIATNLISISPAGLLSASNFNLSTLGNTYTLQTNGTVYFAAPFGNSANSGLTTNAPWPLEYAFAHAGGATLILMDGLYDASQQQTDTPGGQFFIQSTSNMIVEAMHKYGAVIANGTNGGINIQAFPGFTATNITLIGLQVCSNGQAVATASSAGIELFQNETLIDCWIHDNLAMGVEWSDRSFGGNICRRVKSNRNGQFFGSSQGHNHYHDFYVQGSFNILDSCEASDDGDGVGIQQYTSTVGKSNSFNLYYNCLTYGNTNGGGGAGNIFWNGSDTGGSGSVPGTNTAYGCAFLDGISLRMGGFNATNCIALPNANNGNPWFSSVGSPANCQFYEDYFVVTNLPNGPHDISTNYTGLGFVNGPNGLYWLRAGSACRGAALSAACGTNDWFGRPQSSVTDIGPFQYDQALATDKRVLEGIPLTPYGVWQDDWAPVPFDSAFYIALQGGKGNLNTFTNPTAIGIFSAETITAKAQTNTGPTQLASLSLTSPGSSAASWMLGLASDGKTVVSNAVPSGGGGSGGGGTNAATTVLSFGATVATDLTTPVGCITNGIRKFRITATGNFTLSNPTNPLNDGQQATWEIIQDATGGRLVTMDTQFAFGTDITGITLSSAASKRDFITATWNAGASKWYVVGFVRGY